MPSEPVVIAVDAMGGDRAPDVVLDGTRLALEADPALSVLLVGPEDVVGRLGHDRCSPTVATEVIDMGEHPAGAVRAKLDSSIVVGCRRVKDGSAAGFFSAGSTGACMVAATLIMGRLRGVTRPALAAVIPGSERPVVLLDVGANADVKPEMLVQFALMGRAYAQVVLGVPEPAVALLNIGEEPTKGSILAQEAHTLMGVSVPGFTGNVQGRDLAKGSVDVIVTDGFTGNVALKTLEGLAAVLFSQIKESLTESVTGKVGAAMVAPSLRHLKTRLDPEAYGGAPLLGVSGVCIIGHGSSTARAVASGIAVAAHAARGGLTRRIEENITAAAPGV